jgi:hypothetical protein
MGQFAGPDPPQPDLDNDLAMIADRERELERFSAELEGRAEELAAEL